MKKPSLSLLISVVVILLIGAMFVYFYIQLNRTEKKMLAAQATIAQDTAKINAVVNFFNSNLNAQTNKQ